MTRLENKIELITGASRGIGKAIAEVFHKQGAIVILTDISNYEGTIVAELLGEKSEYYELDVKKESDWIEISNTIKTKYGKLDILVNNAGITGFLETNDPFDAEKLAEHRHGNCRKPKEEIAKALRLVVGLAKRSYDSKPHRVSRSTVVNITKLYSMKISSIRHFLFP